MPIAVFGNQDGHHGARKKMILSYQEIAQYVQACRVLGARIVCTIGSWDVLHVGHVRYIMEASRFGDVLIVGVDSDVGVKKYKGPLRPIINQHERMEMVSYLGCVNIVTLITDVDDSGKWQYGLLDAIRPDVFIAVEDSYPEEQRRDIRERCGNLIVLPRQAEDTSSTNIIQKIMKSEAFLQKIEGEKKRGASDDK